MTGRKWRIGARVVFAVACLITLLCLSLFFAAVRNDAAIAEHTGRSTAEVLAVKFDRTIVSFKTPDGATRKPPNGVLYPDGLRVGQLVSIEYDTTNPDLARVAGRSAVLTLLPLGTVVLSTWIVASALLWWARYRRRAAAFLAEDVKPPGASPFVIRSVGTGRHERAAARST